MSELAADETPAFADAAREAAARGKVVHITVHGERLAAIVPESALDVLRATEDAAEADAAMDEPGEDVPWEQVRAELDL
jgi:antitoxin (DNA-binding transcriptional repressor) of toxin-antitoxin stability system